MQCYRTLCRLSCDWLQWMWREPREWHTQSLSAIIWELFSCWLRLAFSQGKKAFCFSKSADLRPRQCVRYLLHANWTRSWMQNLSRSEDDSLCSDVLHLHKQPMLLLPRGLTTSLLFLCVVPVHEWAAVLLQHILNVVRNFYVADSVVEGRWSWLKQ